MTRKAALLTEAISYLILNFVCTAFLLLRFSRIAVDGALYAGGILLFFLLTYGLRPFLGYVLDEIPRFHSQSLGCLAVALACLLPLEAGWVSLFLAAVGNALFSTGAGGESLAFARGYFSRPAVVFGAGMAGTVAGAALPSLASFFVYALLLVLAAVACFFFSEARKYPRRIRSFRHSTVQSLPLGLILPLIALPLLCGALTFALIGPAGDAGPRWISGVCCALGCFAGGVVADRFGPRKAALAGTLIALPLLTVFTHVFWLYCIGLAALNMLVSVSLGAATVALPSRPHFIVGLGSAMALLGSVPSFFSLSVSPSARVISGILLALAGAVSYRVYTDHCKFFTFISRRRKKGAAR